MDCPSCSYRLSQQDQHCPACGQERSGRDRSERAGTRCPDCGASVLESDRYYCPKCGSPVFEDDPVEDNF